LYASTATTRMRNVTQAEPAVRFDARFSDREAAPTPWGEARETLARAELYWLTTVRADGQPHVTPLIGLLHGGAMHFTTGLDEQKARNLEHNQHVVLTTGNNTWAQGLDVVVEGAAQRVIDREMLEALAQALEDKYGSAWHFDVGDGVFVHGERGESEAAVFRVAPVKVIAFAKSPHGQTTYRFAQGH
jgi:nitroimidazol reductase NimA-like FMN-containing flavoprotein (pyridoxamine 5'-phosphate oxidase superfamily)